MNRTWLTTAVVILVLAMPAHAGFDQAAAAFEKRDYATALKELKPLADKGDARSQYAMGVMAENGFGMPKDLSQAANWYRKAAEQGNTDAQFNLGAMYEHGVGMPVNYAQAARWYRPAAESGDIDALSNLGVLYATGRGVPQDKVLALALYNVSVAFDTQQGQHGRAQPPGPREPDVAGAGQPVDGVDRRVAEAEPAEAGLEAYLKRKK